MNPLQQFRLMQLTFGGVGLATIGADFLHRWFGMAMCCTGFAMLFGGAMWMHKLLRKSMLEAEAKSEKEYGNATDPNAADQL
jgi:uncharacterized membrane protein YfcA